MSEPVILAIVAILASTVGALIWVIKYVFDKILPVLESLKVSVDKNSILTEETNKQTVLSTEQTRLNTIQTKASTKQNKTFDAYLRERNGRDSKMWVEVRDSIQKLTKSINKVSE